jgi:hypothetical protein
MRKTSKTTKELAVEFCDRCSSVSTAEDRREALLDQARGRVTAFGGRFA